MSLVHNHVALPALAFHFDVEKGRWTWAAALRDLHGLRASEEPTTERLLEHMHKDDRVVMIGRFQHHLENEGPYSCTYRMRDAAGRRRRLIFVGESEAVAGVVKRLNGFVVDITEPARQIGREAVVAAAAQHSAVDQAKGALMLAFAVDDDGASDLLHDYASRRGVGVNTVAALIVDRLVDPHRDADTPSAGMESIIAGLTEDP